VDADLIVLQRWRDGDKRAGEELCSRYFEEIYRNPPLMGRTAEEKAVIEAWQRRIERDGFYATMEAFRNSTPGLKGRALPGAESYDQIPALA